MAAETFTFNIAKGRGVEYYNRVKSNDPTNSAFILVPLSVGGSAAQGRDFDTLADVLADSNFDEQTGSTWARVTLSDAELAAFPSPDDSNDRYAVAVPSTSLGSPAAGNDVVQILVCYDSNTTSGTDANIVPVTAHAISIETDGNEVVINAGDFLRAS